MQIYDSSVPMLRHQLGDNEGLKVRGNWLLAAVFSGVHQSGYTFGTT